jgi:hypothetical protein
MLPSDLVFVQRVSLPLALLVTRVATDHAHHSLAANDFALLTAAFD